ncbi:MAG: PQQ-dependent sugar dehydrogenase [Saprospiraceae bacterium]|nr:PQQ-dependent sugar dehydrogenase [Saprospiraceae bacterium]
MSCFALVFYNACKQSDAVILFEPSPTNNPEITVTTVVTGNDVIWGMELLPNGDLIYGEKKGKIYIKRGEQTIPLEGFPTVKTGGQGGFMDLKAHPNYVKNGWIYATFTSAVAEKDSEVKLVRFKVKNDKIQNVENIFATGGGNTFNNHYGSRIAFDKNNYLFVSIGEGGGSSLGGPNSTNKNAQDTKLNWGKVHRMKDNGDVPSDNPVLPGNAKPTTMFSYGHRNPQGLTLNPQTGDIWETEHGPKGGDEINIISKGENYGWPTYSIGINYNGTTVSNDHKAEGIKEPIFTWTPSIGVCGITFINSENFKSWNGNFLATGLAGQKLYRFVIKDNKIVEENIWMEKMGRFRNVIQGSDGAIYISLESPGRILKVTAK